MDFLPGLSKKCLGIDIGATSIKVVELSKEKDGYHLKNYGIASTKDVTGRKIRAKSNSRLSASTDAIADTVKTILKEAGMRTKDSVFAIPDSSSFFTSFEVPKMKRAEVESAIQFQARQRIPLSLNQVTLDWKLTGLNKSDGKEMVEVLLLAIPNDTINSYRTIAKKTGLSSGVLDAQTFGFAELYGEEDKTVVIVDVGDQNTMVNIVEEGLPKHSHSLDLAGKDFTPNIAILPKLEYNEKEKTPKVSDKIKKSLSRELAQKIDEVCSRYENEEGRSIDKILLTGGASNFERIKIELSKTFTTEVANPFQKIKYPPILEEMVEDLSPLCSVAMGMAMQGLNK